MRLDLYDFNNIQNFVCADFAAIHKYVWTNDNYVLSGFVASGETTTTLSVAVAESSLIIGKDEGTMYIGAPSLAPLTTQNLTPSETNFVELSIVQDSGGADSRAFWDQTASGGDGGEFSQIVDTFIFTKAQFEINTSSFTGDANKIPICEVVTDGSGTITTIRDARPMFWRLGKPSNPSYSYPWVDRNDDPTNASFSGADKNIASFKEWADAMMDAIREVKGTTYWFQPPFTSVTGTFQNTGLSVLSAASVTAKFAWSGSALSITDESPSGSPENDNIAYLRLFNSLVNLNLKRQDINGGAPGDPNGAIEIGDGEVLYIEIPDGLGDTDFSEVGITSSNFKISSRGSIPLDESIYWLAFRENTKLYLRGLGELEPGEAQEINDSYSDALKTFLGFDPETATSVPYSVFPNSLIFARVFDTSTTLVEAISTNTFNINALGTIVNEKAYSESYDVVVSASTQYELTGPVPAGTNLSLPNDSRNGFAPKEYVVGEGILKLFHDGILLREGVDYNELGTAGTTSTDVEILIDLEIGEPLTFRIDSLGGFNVGASGGGDVIGASNVGGGTGEVFKQKASGLLELRSIIAGSGISVTTVGDQIVIALAGGAATPYFRTDINGQIGTLVNVGGTYNLGTDKLEVYRGGVLMLNTTSTGLGDNDDRYQEATNTTISLEATGDGPAEAGEVFSFVNQDTDPTSKIIISGVTGGVLTVPSYTLGANELRVFRNGILLNDQGLGSILDRYSETSTTSITLASPASSTEVFTVFVGPTPSSRQDIGSLTPGTIVLNLANSYSIGSGELLLYRNGALMYNSTTLGISATSRYQETTANSVTLENGTASGEYFTAIIK
jgi:hypothetical protein